MTRNAKFIMSGQLIGQSGSTLISSPDSIKDQAGTSVLTCSKHTLDPQQLIRLMGELSAEEKEELRVLKEAHKVSNKAAKIKGFQKLPSEMRQFVINALTWMENLHEINNTTAMKTPRHVELEQKESQSLLLTYFTTVDSHNIFIPTIGLPGDLTADDLKQAHVEATIEEEMLNGKK